MDRPTEHKPKRCQKCQDLPSVAFDTRTQAWDCAHVCYDRCYGAVNQPTLAQAVEAWNKIVEGNNGQTD